MSQNKINLQNTFFKKTEPNKCSLQGMKETQRLLKPGLYKNKDHFQCYLSHYSYLNNKHPTPVLMPGKSHGRRRLQSMGLQRVGLNLVTSLLLFTFMHWRRKWQPTPVFLPGESQGRGSLVGCRLWGCTELDTTEAIQQQQ